MGIEHGPSELLNISIQNKKKSFQMQDFILSFSLFLLNRRCLFSGLKSRFFFLLKLCEPLGP